MRIHRLGAVLDITGDTRSPLYDKVSKGLFTRAIKLGGARSAGWPSYEVEQLVAARIRGDSNEQIKKLVDRLHAARATLCVDDGGPKAPAVEPPRQAQRQRARGKGADVATSPERGAPHALLAGKVKAAIRGALAAQRALSLLRSGVAHPDALHLELAPEQDQGDGESVRGLVRELQRAIERDRIEVTA